MHFPGEDELHSFPTMSDFSVTLVDSDDRGKRVEFTSDRYGRLAWFPAWEHADRDLRHFTPMDVPLGSLDEPYQDADEQWRIALFEHRGFVYVLEADEPGADDYPRFFRVPSERYIASWSAVIDAYNPITPLDETEE